MYVHIQCKQTLYLLTPSSTHKTLPDTRLQQTQTVSPTKVAGMRTLSLNFIAAKNFRNLRTVLGVTCSLEFHTASQNRLNSHNYSNYKTLAKQAQPFTQHKGLFCQFNHGNRISAVTNSSVTTGNRLDTLAYFKMARQCKSLHRHM